MNKQVNKQILFFSMTNNTYILQFTSHSMNVLVSPPHRFAQLQQLFNSKFYEDNKIPHYIRFQLFQHFSLTSSISINVPFDNWWQVQINFKMKLSSVKSLNRKLLPTAADFKKNWKIGMSFVSVFTYIRLCVHYNRA